jgi:hypothetical protein
MASFQLTNHSLSSPTHKEDSTILFSRAPSSGNSFFATIYASKPELKSMNMGCGLIKMSNM